MIKSILEKIINLKKIDEIFKSFFQLSAPQMKVERFLSNGTNGKLKEVMELTEVSIYG